jgi:hypothetical protein
MPATRVDNVALTRLIERCFILSASDRVPERCWPDFLAMGKRLRGCLVNVLTAEFETNTPALVAANGRLKDLNKQLKKTTLDLEEAADTVEDLGKLAKALDDLLRVAASFM